MTPPSLQTHWTSAQAAKAMGVHRQTLWWWRQPRPWREVPLLVHDEEASRVAGQLMFRVADVVAAERESRVGRAMRKPKNGTSRR